MILQKPYKYDSNLLIHSKKSNLPSPLLFSSTKFDKKKLDSYGTLSFLYTSSQKINKYQILASFFQLLL